jgi:hypothetical protein
VLAARWQSCARTSLPSRSRAKARELLVERGKVDLDEAEVELLHTRTEGWPAALVSRDCAKAYIEALGGLFEGDSVSAQPETVRRDLQNVTADCKDALAGALLPQLPETRVRRLVAGVSRRGRSAGRRR